MAMRRLIVLAQLPIPPLGPQPIRGNVPLAAAYLQLFARRQGLEDSYEFSIISAQDANALGDQALVQAIAERNPWLAGFTCYVWNIERTLWICRELRRLRPDLKIILGGPEITFDNQWVLDSPDYDFAVIGEGEQTFAELLSHLRNSRRMLPQLNYGIPGLYVPSVTGPRFRLDGKPAFREPLHDINQLGSPYLAGILDAADEQMLLLETTRGCVFKCKFCYYPKSYDQQYFLSFDLVRANLRHARERGAAEVFLLDPTLNQRNDFADLLRLIAEENPHQQFRCFGELRAEGITETTARLLRQANFTEVEVGLQSIDPDAMDLMDRKNHLRAFERGVRAMRGDGISVKVDLIVGLPGDTVESVRRGMHYLRDGRLFDDVQVFNLAILPGTDFREEAAQLGLKFQSRPPYYALQTSTLSRTELFQLMQEAEDIFGVEFDALPPPVLEFTDADAVANIDLDDGGELTGPAKSRRQAFTLWFRSHDFARHQESAARIIRQALAENPFTTLQVILEPSADAECACVSDQLSLSLLHDLFAVCLEQPTYLDRYYSMQPGGLNGAKRLILLLPEDWQNRLPAEWLDRVGEHAATVVWKHSREFTIPLLHSPKQL
ncbi:MAG TPA: radical SAM protein [Gemmataceae bacterium]|nr:radical SAM protein [Gemmataceae bacterium]